MLQYLQQIIITDKCGLFFFFLLDYVDKTSENSAKQMAKSFQDESWALQTADFCTFGNSKPKI